MYKEIIESDRSVKTLLGLERLYSTEVYEHSVNVAGLTVGMLKAYEEKHRDGQFKKMEKSIVTGALLHDIGKVFLPFNLTGMPRKLRDEEMGIVKIHSYIGYEILKEGFDDVVCNIAKMHHEKINGSGYPENRKREDIPEYVRMVQCADIFDALHSERVYKKALDKKSSLKIMQEDAKRLCLDDKYLSLLCIAVAKL